VLTDNGKVFTGRFGLHPVEVLFDRLCRENGISHRLTAVRAPTTTGKIERFHQSLRKEFLADRSFRSMAVAQDALDEWVNDYTPRTTPGARDGHSGRSFSIAACESDGTLVPTESTASLTVSRAGSANCRRFPSLRSAQSSGGGLLLHDRHGDDPASGNRSGWLSGMIRCRPPSRSSPVKRLDSRASPSNAQGYLSRVGAGAMRSRRRTRARRLGSSPQYVSARSDLAVYHVRSVFAQTLFLSAGRNYRR
jgi:Integrase core domain